MEDAAAAGISRSQLWEWLHNPNVKLEDGRPITVELYRSFIPQAMARIRSAVGEDAFAQGKFEEAVGTAR